MAVEDVYRQNRRLPVRLSDNGGKRHAMPTIGSLRNTPQPPISPLQWELRRCSNPGQRRAGELRLPSTGQGRFNRSRGLQARRELICTAFGPRRGRSDVLDA
jgi:hypothetical protein